MSELEKLKLIGKMGKINSKLDMCHSPQINQKCDFQLDFYKIPVDELKSISKIDLKVVYEDDEIKPDNKTDGKAAKKLKKRK